MMSDAINEHEKLKSATAMSWLDKLSCAGLLGGTTASLIWQNAAFATVPVSALLVFQVFSRHQKIAALVESCERSHQSIAATKQELHANAATCEDMFRSQERALDGLIQNSNKHNLEMITLKEMLEEQSKGLAKYAGQLNALEDTVESVKKIAASTTSITSEATSAEAHFTRGIHQEKLGHLEVAIQDYSQAIEMNQDHAEAYLRRGIAKAKLGRKQSAVIDFNLATKHFFEVGDLVNYQRAKEIAANIHQVKNLVDTPDLSSSETERPDKAELTTINDMFGE